VHWSSATYCSGEVDAAGRCRARWTAEPLAEPVTALSWHPSGRLIALAGGRDVRVFETEHFELVRVLSDYAGTVAFSPDRSHLASDGAGVRIWDVASGLTEHVMGHDAGPPLAYSPDGHRLATGSGYLGEIHLYDPDTAELVQVLPGYDDLVALAFSPDGAFLASAGFAEQVSVWRLSPGVLADDLGGDLNEMEAVAFSPDGRYLLASGWWRADNPVTAVLVAWSPAGEGTVVRRHRDHGASVDAIAFSPDSTLYACATVRGEVFVYRTEDGSLVTTLAGRGPLAFSPDGTLLAGSGAGNSLVLWHVPGFAAEVPLAGQSGGILSLDWLPDGSHVFSGGPDGAVREWPAAGLGGSSLVGGSSLIRSVDVSPDGSLVAAGDDDSEVRVWELPGGEAVATLPAGSREVGAVRFAPDGSRLVAGTGDGLLRGWALPMLAEETGMDLGLPGGAHSLAFSHDSAYLAVGGVVSVVGVIDMRDHRVIRTFGLPFTPTVPGAAVAYAPDDSLLAGAALDELRLWRTDDWSEALSTSTLTAVTAVDFSPDGRWLVTAESSQVRVRDVPEGRVVRRLVWHTAGVQAVAFSPDGRVLASGGDDTVVRFFDVADLGEEPPADGDPGDDCDCATVDTCCDGCHWRDGRAFCDDFGTTELDETHWCRASPEGVSLTPDGILELSTRCDPACACGACTCGAAEAVCSCAGACHGSEVSTCGTFHHGTLRVALSATTGCVDTSFGFEQWLDVDGEVAHVGIVVTHGTLGILNHLVCSRVPSEREVYVPLADPARLCSGSATVELVWAGERVEVLIDGVSAAQYEQAGGAVPIPDVPLPVRLNSSNDRPDHLDIDRLEVLP
jgi:WD40 repeat protein